MRVAVVLDETALVRYAKAEDVAVGELLGEIADEEAFAVVPVSSVALARASLTESEDRAMLTFLVEENPCVVVVPMVAEDGRRIGVYTAAMAQQLGLAHAAIEAKRHFAQLVTANGDVVRKAVGEMHGIVDL